MTNKELVKKVKKIVDDGITLAYDYGNNMACVHHKKGAFLLEFIIRYERIVSNYIGQTSLNPEEYDLDIEIQAVDDFIVYINNEVQELTDDEIDDLQKYTFDSLVKNN